MTTQARRILTLAAVGVAVFAVMTAAIWYFMWRPTRYVDTAHGFSILFSPEWEFTGPGEGASARAHRTLADTDGMSAAAISVLATPIENIPDAPTYRAWFIKNVIGKFKGYTRLEEGTRATPAGQVPWILFLHRTEEDARGQVWQFYFVKNNTGFIISCASDPSSFERFRREFTEAVDSFQLD
jgi:hypothetical protein